MGKKFVVLVLLTFVFALPVRAQRIYSYFNHAEYNSYTDPYRNIPRNGDDLEAVLLHYISQAKSSILVAIHELRLPRVAQALADAKNQRGVNVMVVLENTYNNTFVHLTQGQIRDLPDYYRSKYLESLALLDQNQDGRVTEFERSKGDAIYILQKNKIPLVDDTFDGSAGSGLMHHKFMIIDEATLIVSSANFTTSDIHGDMLNLQSRGNANGLMVFESYELSSIFKTEFFIMFGDGTYGSGRSFFGARKPYRGIQTVMVGGVPVSVQFAASPSNIDWRYSTNGFIAQSLASAKLKVLMALFVFSDQQLVDILETRHDAGVFVSALIDPNFASRDWSEMLDMWGIKMRNRETCRYEDGNRVWENPIEYGGIPQLPYGDKLHHKFAVIDDSKVLFGSQNWSYSGAFTNDENILLIQSPNVAHMFSLEYQRLVRISRFGPTERIINQIKEIEMICSGYN
ncbi:MAG: hypothetical protein JNM93_07905 [Bacteriovoracaceae bacterium]|nr:hypothetical protein [Bacteriovoracaceae bacterium]